jgi:hypothetical protein
MHLEHEKLKTSFMYYRIHVEIKFLNDPIFPPSMVYFLYLPCQICGSEKASPCAGIIKALKTHQKGTVSLGEATHAPQFWNGLQENELKAKYAQQTMLGFQKNPKRQLEEYLIFCYTLPSELLEHFAFTEVLGQ